MHPTFLLHIAQAATSTADNQSVGDLLFYALVLLLVALILGAGMMLMFLYMTGRLAARTVEHGMDAGSRVAVSALDNTGRVVTTSVETAGDVTKTVVKTVAEGAGAIGRAMAEFAQERSSAAIYAAIYEARPTFEIVTCKMNSVVYHKLERRGWNRLRGLVEIMPVEVSYGFDMTGFKQEDIKVSEDGERIEITLPPLKVVSLEKGTPSAVFNNLGKLDVATLRECQATLDQRMREYARSPKTLSIAEELSLTSFRQILRMIFYLVEEEKRPKHVEVRVRSRGEYRLVLPEPLYLESHFQPDKGAGEETA